MSVKEIYLFSAVLSLDIWQNRLFACLPNGNLKVFKNLKLKHENRVSNEEIIMIRVTQ